MVTNPVPPIEEEVRSPPNMIVLGEMTMTTNNTDEEEKAAALINQDETRSR